MTTRGGKKKCVVAGVCVWRTTLNRGAYGSVGGARGSVGGARKRGLVTLVPVQINLRVFLLFAVLPPLFKCAASQRQLKNKTKVQQHGGTRRRRNKDVVAGPFEAARFPAGDRNFRSSPIN